MPPIRVGVIGCGAIAQIMHLPYLRELDDRFEITAICDLSPSLLAYIGDRYAVPRRYRDHHELIADPGVDAVLILSGGDHASVVIEALRAGRHVLCEKPLTYTVANARAVAAAQAECSARLLMGYSVAFDPAVEAIRGELAGWKRLDYVSLQICNPENTATYAHLDVRSFTDTPDWARGATSLLDDSNPVMGQIESVIGSTPDAAMAQAFFTLHGSCIHETYTLRLLLGEEPEIIDARAWDQGRCVAMTVRYPDEVVVQQSWIFNHGLIDYRQALVVVGGSKRLEAHWPSPYHPSAPTRFQVREMQDEAVIARTVQASYEESFKLELLHFHDVCCGRAQPLHNARHAVLDTAHLNRAAQLVHQNMV
ncbi:MAG: Gfo/Idh/MocA family oxidoreductase [Chloroflexota bacterium]|nr:Gfo/Idh/MocA family oxidoreductase [Chloroflexota bacterium]MXY12860.1 Gfo/Idh/MocA family oxidoreductase [Chloroflexota bacterium]